MSNRFGPALAATALAGLALAVPSSPAQPAPVASAAALHNCHLSPSEQEHMGASYVTSLKVARVTCATGKKVVKAFQRCRRAHGGVRGRCPRSVSVLGYHCTEKRGGIATQITGKVTCTRGVRRVVHTYTQFT